MFHLKITARTAEPYPWSQLSYGLSMEILQHLDIRTHRRLSRVCSDWQKDICKVPRTINGTVLITWKDIRWPNDKYEEKKRKWIGTVFKNMKWPQLLGCDPTIVRHMVFQGNFPFSYWTGMPLGDNSLDPNFTLATFPHRLSQITVVDCGWWYVAHLFDASEFVPSATDLPQAHIKGILTSSTDSLSLLNVSINPRSALQMLWLTYYPDVPGVDTSIFRRTLTGSNRLSDGGAPFVRYQVPKISFNMETYRKYCYGPEKLFCFLPWLSDVLISSDLLFNYPPVQHQWLQHCIDMLPVVAEGTSIEDGIDFWTRDAIKFRLRVKDTWREYYHVPRNTFPATDIFLDGLSLDTLDCEILAQWFLATKIWRFRHDYFSQDGPHQRTGRKFSAIHPDYPCPPCHMAAPNPPSDSNHWRSRHVWLSTLSAQTQTHPRPSLMDLRILWQGYTWDLQQRCRHVLIMAAFRLRRFGDRIHRTFFDR